MKKLLIAIGLISGVLLSSCSDDDPTGPSESTKAVIRVFVNENCEGGASNIKVYIDDLYVGMTQPGSTGITKQMSVGNHEIYAVSQEGVVWSLFTVYLPENGLDQRLSCN